MDTRKRMWSYCLVGAKPGASSPTHVGGISKMAMAKVKDAMRIRHTLIDEHTSTTLDRSTILII